MGQKTKACLLAILTVSVIIAIAFIPMPTKQGVNHVVRVYSIPLYIKTIEFLDRDFRYRQIIAEIAPSNLTARDRVLSIFNWCVKKIKHQPEGLPVVDDHPYSIILRGYGIEDQFEDIFTILCTYAGYESFYRVLKSNDGSENYVSFVRYEGQWHIFSAWRNAYPPDKQNYPASVEYVKSNPVSLVPFLKKFQDLDSALFLRELDGTYFKATSMRVKGQSPFGRLVSVFARAATGKE